MARASTEPTGTGTGTALRTPATRDQVDAYRFGLRRLEAALVRGDPVPLHEQIRSQRRAVLAGAVLGLLALGAVAAYGVVVPAPDWTRQAVVVGRSSGSVYVVAHGPDRLVPVANVAAGRLVLAALRDGGASDADPATAEPVLVDDDALAGAARSPAAAVPGAGAVRPAGTVPPRWAVCDEVAPTGPGATAELAGTTVVAGAAPAAAPGDGAVLLAVPGGSTWLVTAGHRHRVDLGDAPVVAALGLGGAVPRPATPGLVSALPEGPRLATPPVPGAGGPGPRGVPGAVGAVLVTRPAGGGERHHVVLAGGLQEVPPLVADVLVAAGSARIDVGPDVLTRAAPVAVLDVGGWPAVPALREPAAAPVVCWTWSGGPGADPDGGVLVGTAPPAPAGAVPVALAQADGAGERTDRVVVAAGGGAVRATAPGAAPGVGTVWVVSATGVAHGVADDATAAALGITAAEPAPEAALRLLPSGPVLDVAQAARAVDVLASAG